MAIINTKKMKKIYFNDNLGLTQAVLDRRKTMTRRIVPIDTYNMTDWKEVEGGNYMAVSDVAGNYFDIRRCGNYGIGNVVAIAQAYKDIPWFSEREEYCRNMPEYTAGWTNKMFVAAKYMPHHIFITDIRVERLQDISEEDCLKEGIYKYSNCGLNGYTFDGYSNDERAIRLNSSPRGAFAALIDKVSGKGTWESNPFCFCYTFELID